MAWLIMKCIMDGRGEFKEAQESLISLFFHLSLHSHRSSFESSKRKYVFGLRSAWRHFQVRYLTLMWADLGGSLPSKWLWHVNLLVSSYHSQLWWAWSPSLSSLCDCPSRWEETTLDVRGGKYWRGEFYNQITTLWASYTGNGNNAHRLLLLLYKIYICLNYWYVHSLFVKTWK